MFDWVVLVNPEAGRRPVSVARLQEALARHRLSCPVEVVSGADEMSKAVVEVATSGRSPAVVGGDGTAGLAAQALVDAQLDRCLAVLPSGTGCDILRTFGISQTLEEAVAHLATPATYRIDVGSIEGGWGRRLFVNEAEVGVGAAAAETAVRLPRRLGKARYPAAFAARLPAFPKCEVRVEGRRRFVGEALAVIMANGQYFAGGWNVAPKAMMMDGELDVQVFAVRKWEAPALVPRIIKGTHLTHPGVWRRSLETISIDTEVPWPVEADGDFLGSTPVEVKVLPGALQLKI